MAWAVVCILGAAALAPALGRWRGAAGAWGLALVPLGVAVFFLVGAPRPVSIAWAPSLGAAVALRADGLATLMAVLITGIGGLVVIYAGGYLGAGQRRGAFFAALLVFIASMLALVLADNVFLLFIAWELTSVCSFLLIGFEYDKPAARAGAKQALLTTGAGGLALLGGLVVLAYMGMRAGLAPMEATTLSVLLQHGAALRADALYPVALLLILVGCFTKSAQVPFHYWLPAAMVGPTPVSALLHSATMVKAGVFLLARLNPALGGTGLWITLLTVFGAATMITGAVMAVGQRDLKAILAYTTVSVLGTLVMLLGIGTAAALNAAVVFLTAHALYKAALFMVAGNVDHEAGTRNLARLSGLWRAMPVTAAAALLAALSKAGAPPALGYLGKKLSLEAKLGAEALGQWLILAAMLTNVAMVAVALTVAIRPFWGAPSATPRHAHEAPLSMWLGPLLLALTGLAVGLVPAFFEQGLAVAASSAIAGAPLELKLTLWAGLSVEALLLIALSVGAFVAGFLVYRKLERVWARPPALGALKPWTPTTLYDRTLAIVQRVAHWHTRWLQAGYLRLYVAAVLLATVLLIGPWLVRAGWPSLAPGAWGLHVHELVIGVLIIAGALGGVMARAPMAAALSIGVAGIGLALVFALFGGPDLAITQLMVETLVLLMLALVLTRLPGHVRPVRRPAKLGGAVLAGAVGVTVTGLVLLVAAITHEGHVARAMLEKAAPEAFGRNVVNVVLVDFRALDTLGEITVVAAAAFGALALLGRRARPAARREEGR